MSTFNTYKANKMLTPVNEPVSSLQTLNTDGGGYAFTIGDEKQLERFLILGTTGGTFYTAQKDYTTENVAVIKRLLAIDGEKVLRQALAISTAGRAESNDPALFVWALAIAYGDVRTRATAVSVLPNLARYGTDFFHAISFALAHRGWGRALRQAVQNWYTSKDIATLQYQTLKYQQRDGMSHGKLLRYSHVKASNNDIAMLYRYIINGVGGEKGVAAEALTVLPQVESFERIKAATTVREVVSILEASNLPRECVPTKWLSERVVWEVLLDTMPLGALLRQLPTLTKHGIFKAPALTERAVRMLTSKKLLRKARLHPLQIVVALNTYTQGRSTKGESTWTPDKNIVAALDKAFYLSFHTLEPTGKRFCVANDISASMSSCSMPQTGLTPAAATALMSAVWLATEPHVELLAFNTQLIPYNLKKGTLLTDLLHFTQAWSGGGTNVSAPLQWALQNKKVFDVFVVQTDNETNAGVHVHEALNAYRQKINPKAKMVVVGMTATKFSVAARNDAGSLDVVGFDSAVPNLINKFVSL